MKAFLNSPINTKPVSSPETPYLRAKQEWDSRIGSTVIQAKNWRVACFVSLTLAGFSLAISLVLATKQTITPVFVGIDRESGEPMVLGDINNNSYKPGPVEVKYFLSEFIKLVRGLPLDPVLTRENWIKAYSFTRKNAAEVLNQISAKEYENGQRKIGNSAVSVQPISVVQIPNTSSYQVRWKETAYTKDGQKLEEYTMLGTFVVEITPPRDEQTLQVNPLGLYIQSFEWSREL